MTSSSEPNPRTSQQLEQQRIITYRRQGRCLQVVVFLVALLLAVTSLSIMVCLSNGSSYWRYDELRQYYDETKYVIAKDLIYDTSVIAAPFDSDTGIYYWSGYIQAEALIPLKGALRASIADTALIGEVRLSDGYIYPITINYDEVCAYIQYIKENHLENETISISGNADWCFSTIGFFGIFHRLAIAPVQFMVRLTGWSWEFWSAILSVVGWIMAIVLFLFFGALQYLINFVAQDPPEEPHVITVICHYDGIEPEFIQPKSQESDIPGQS